jgi:hypothetical protein
MKLAYESLAGPRARQLGRMPDYFTRFEITAAQSESRSRAPGAFRPTQRLL